MKCNSNCLICEENSTNCTVCNGLYRNNNPPTCSCIDGYYDNGIQGDCLKCTNKCKTCN